MIEIVFLSISINFHFKSVNLMNVKESNETNRSNFDTSNIRLFKTNLSDFF